ncbi:hypothetical protein [Terricaulis silvestris]|uniref:Monovalent cation/H+ antiporter subunit F n=1 Tax=Terricaulis silvestris TaxID=2686094 RepID=A0A6I6MS48_9CAUL|nr:hypothetical protein [Terricaulis silvestris]QGZ95607.1 hypothetical protein DSM104635_02457 [Terricaulis silvestris]
MGSGFIVQAAVLIGAFMLLLMGAVAAWTAPNATKRVAGVIVALIGAIIAMAALQAPPSWLIAGAAVALGYCVVGTTVVVRLQEAYGAAETSAIDAADDEGEPPEPGA